MISSFVVNFGVRRVNRLIPVFAPDGVQTVCRRIADAPFWRAANR